MRTITITGGTLFDIANRMYGDATKWTIIASANEISDPWLVGLTTLVIPDPLNSLGAEVVTK